MLMSRFVLSTYFALLFSPGARPEYARLACKGGDGKRAIAARLQLHYVTSFFPSCAERNATTVKRQVKKKHEERRNRGTAPTLLQSFAMLFLVAAASAKKIRQHADPRSHLRAFGSATRAHSSSWFQIKAYPENA